MYTIYVHYICTLYIYTLYIYIYIFFFGLFVFLGLYPQHIGGSQARGPIRATANRPIPEPQQSQI